MKVKILTTGKIENVNDSYGARLIEQGKAILTVETKEEPKVETAKKVAEAPVKEYKTKRSQKGE